jgi:hypothetical protein
MVVACAFTNHRKNVSVDLVSRKLPKRETSTACTPWRVEARLLDLLNRTTISNLFWFSTHERYWSIELDWVRKKNQFWFFFRIKKWQHTQFFFFFGRERESLVFILIKPKFSYNQHICWLLSCLPKKEKPTSFAQSFFNQLFFW